MTRKVLSANEFFEIFDKIGDNQFFTIGYVTGANLEIPKVKRKNPQTNRMKGYPDYSVLPNESGSEIGALVKITTYNMRYRKRNVFNNQYKNYKDSANSIRAEYGLDPIGTRQGYKQDSGFGTDSPSLYNGGNTDLQSHSYLSQNTFGANIKGTVYAVDKEGHIIRSFEDDEIKAYLKAKREPDGVAALRKMGVEEERIQEYIAKLKDLKFNYRNFEADSILWIAATVNGEKIIYLNNNLQRSIDDVNIQPHEFRKIARERYNISLNDLHEMVMKDRYMNSNLIRLTESDLHMIVKESVNKLLNESFETKQQWEREKRAFFSGLKNGKAIVDGDMVAVELGRHNERDPRYVCFRLGDNKLTDDHFYVQNSPTLSKRSLNNLYQLLSFVYGVDVSEYQYDEGYGGLR